jgi:hypothetical protein
LVNCDIVTKNAAPTTEVSAAERSFMELTAYSGIAWIWLAKSFHPLAIL